jgi:D-alanyl-D-alanine carboxypeptidase
VAAALDAVIATGVNGAVVYVRDGTRTALLARGFSDPPQHVAMRVGDRFRIGTVTRSFVATAVLQLVAAHKLGLDERVDQAAPGLLPKRHGAITVRQLLQGTSGLWDYLQAPPWNHSFRAAAFQRTWTPRQLLAIGLSHKPYASPGAMLDAWSSTPWIALGLIVERVTGQPLGAVLRERIFSPLGLRATSFSPGTATPKGLAHGWARNGVDVTAVNSSWAWANGSIVSTASDVARFYRALLQGRLLPRSLMKQMETVRWFNRYLIGVGFGLGLERTKTLMLAKHLPALCRVAWGYEGTHLGYTVEALSSIDGRRQVVIMLNEDPGALTPDWQAPSALFHLADKALCT